MQAIRGRVCAVCATAPVAMPVKAAMPAMPVIPSISRRVISRFDSMVSVVVDDSAALGTISFCFFVMIWVTTIRNEHAAFSLNINLHKYLTIASCSNLFFQAICYWYLEPKTVALLHRMDTIRGWPSVSGYDTGEFGIAGSTKKEKFNYCTNDRKQEKRGEISSNILSVYR